MLQFPSEYADYVTITAALRLTHAVPADPYILNDTSYVPGDKYWWVVFRRLLVLPAPISPNFQYHAEGWGYPIPASVNVTVRGADPDEGYTENPGTYTDTYFVAFRVFDPASLAAVKMTSYCPPEEYVFEGFWRVDEFPSPKYQDQEVGIFSEVSVNWTVRGANPMAMSEVNWATGMVLLVLVEFDELPASPVPFIVVFAAASITGRSPSVGIWVTIRDPGLAVTAGWATY